MRFIVATTLLGASLAAPAALAEPAVDMDAVRACRGITSDLGRLACFDKLANDASSPAQPAASAPAAAATAPTPSPSPAVADAGGTGAWLHRQSRDGLDQSMVETVALPAARANVGLINKPGMRQGPVLVVRCKEKQLAVYVAFDLAITGSDPAVPVQFRIGDTAPKSAVWGRAQDNEAIGFWDTARATALLQALSGQHDFFVRASPPNKFQSEAEFKLDGIDAAVQPVRAACGV